MDFKLIYGGNNSGLFEINLRELGVFPLFIAFVWVYVLYIQSFSSGVFRTLVPSISFEDVNICYTLSLCLLFTWVFLHLPFNWLCFNPCSEIQHLIKAFGKT